MFNKRNQLIEQKKNSNDLVAGMVVGACIIGAIWSFIFTLADVASKPAVHSASYAVRHNTSPYLPQYETIDQSRATKVSRSGLDSDLLVGVVR